MSGAETPLSEEMLMAYADGALDAVEAARVETVLAADPQARATLATLQDQTAALQALYNPVGEEPLPAEMRAMLDAAAQEPAVVKPAFSAMPFLRTAAMLGLLAIGAAGGWTTARLNAPAPAARDLAQNALQAHETFVVEVAHPVEVMAEEAAHLTGWVSKRLGHDIAPPDFAGQGFRLMGGRVLPGADGPAALFMYENDLGRRVTLYVAAPGQGGETAFQFAETGAYHSFYWIDGALSYAVVGDIPRDALRRIALMAYDQLI